MYSKRKVPKSGDYYISWLNLLAGKIINTAPISKSLYVKKGSGRRREVKFGAYLLHQNKINLNFLFSSS